MTIPSPGKATLHLVLSLGLAVACASPQGDTAVVSGKTVFREMAVEGVVLEVYPASGPEPGTAVRGHSGYHGSFSVRLAPGSYRLAARGTLAGPGGTDRLLEGTRSLEVPAGTSRVDRVVVELRDRADSRP